MNDNDIEKLAEQEYQYIQPDVFDYNKRIDMRRAAFIKGYKSNPSHTQILSDEDIRLEAEGIYGDLFGECKAMFTADEVTRNVINGYIRGRKATPLHNDGWIRVEDDLPELSREILAVLKDDDVVKLKVSSFDAGCFGRNEVALWKYYHSPLPSPINK